MTVAYACTKLRRRRRRQLSVLVVAVAVVCLRCALGGVVAGGTVLAAGDAGRVVDGVTSVIFGEERFLDFPNICLCADAELEVFLRD